jgi:hypothetical protein
MFCVDIFLKFEDFEGELSYTGANVVPVSGIISFPGQQRLFLWE